MEYNGTIYRPTAEANTFLVPVTEGCTHNKCHFCSMFKGVPFRMVKKEAIAEYLEEEVGWHHNRGVELERVFLVGADPFALSADRLEEVIDLIREYIPECRLFTMYAAVRNIRTKTDDDLVRLHELGVDDLYVGIESALEDVLTYFNKGNTAAEATEQMLRLNKAGIRHRDMIIPGAGGKGRGTESGMAFAKMFSETKPSMILFTAMSFFPGTGLYEDRQKGKFVPAREKEVLQEEITMFENMDSPDTYIWAVHSLNSVRMTGNFGENKEEMLQRLRDAYDKLDEDQFEKTFRREHL